MRVRSIAAATVLLVACGEEDPGPMPPPAAGIEFAFDLGDPCAEAYPRPTDLFRADDLTWELSSCPETGSPVDNAIDRVLVHDGAAIDRAIVLPVGGGKLDAASLVVKAFSLTSSTSSVARTLPAIVFFERIGTATSAAGWRAVAHDLAFDGKDLRVTPLSPLGHGREYVLIATDGVGTEKKNPIGPNALVQKLVGSAPVAIGEGLDAAAAMRLERERLRLAPFLALAARAGLTAARITSAQRWRTTAGPELLEGVVEQYRAARARGRFAFDVMTTGGDIAPADVYPPGTPARVFDKVRAFRRGTIKVPSFVGEDGLKKSGWDGPNASTHELPFLMSIPTGVTRYSVAVLLPGLGRSSQDARAIAQELAGGPQAAVLALDLRGYAARASSQVDMRPNNGNPEIAGPDGIPDSSGLELFSGDPGKLRAQQIGAVLEVVHVLEALKDVRAFEEDLINPDGRAGSLHLIGHGQTAEIALHAARFSTLGTIQTPAGGVGIAALIGEGPDALEAAFLREAPAGVDATTLEDYLGKLERRVMSTLGFGRTAQEIGTRYLRQPSRPARVLLAHGGLPEFVSATARRALVDALMLPADRISRHAGFCDDFFLYTCRSGENPAIVPRARDQLAAFASSGGQSVLSPAN